MTAKPSKTAKPAPPKQAVPTVVSAPESERVTSVIADAAQRPVMLLELDVEHSMPLDDDHDVSITRSLAIHMMSEHGIANACQLDDADAEIVHKNLHAEADFDHTQEDTRFRPTLAVNVMERAHARHEEIQRNMNIPQQKTA